MNEFFGIDPNIPLFHMVPLVVFGPIFLLVLYHIGLKEIINPSAETRERRRLKNESEQRIEADSTRKLKAAGLYRGGLKRTPLQWAGQGITFTLFAISIAWFSSSPAYVANPPENGLIKLSLTHPGKRKVECRKLSAAETQKIAVNMRSGMSCPRERWPLRIELMVDDKQVFAGSARPAGFSKDGHSSFYEKFPVVAGPHRITVRLSDTGGDSFNYVSEMDVVLKPAQILAVSFDNQTGRLVIGD